MKKIIELLERLSAQLKYNTDALSLEVCEYVRVRKELEQTPITEEWLREHYWQRCWEGIGWWNIRAPFTLQRYSDTEWNIENSGLLIKTLADLYDVAELYRVELK